MAWDECGSDYEEAVRQCLVEERLSPRNKAILVEHRSILGIDLATLVLQRAVHELTVCSRVPGGSKPNAAFVSETLQGTIDGASVVARDVDERDPAWAFA